MPRPTPRTLSERLRCFSLLSCLQGEQGATEVEGALNDGGTCGAANWSEIAQKIRAHGRNWDLSGALLASYGVQAMPDPLRLEPLTEGSSYLTCQRSLVFYEYLY